MRVRGGSGQLSPTMAFTMTKRDTHPHGYRTMCVTIVPVLQQCTRLSYGGNSSISQMSIIEGKSTSNSHKQLKRGNGN
jgi:hypothetical protein